MATFDITQISEFREVFPELTPVQFETAMLFALGISRNNIAELRSVSYTMIKRALNEAKIKLNLSSANNLPSVFLIRLILFMLQEYRLQQRT